MTTPIVAIVGRPNVGKSTLFNRLAGKPLAIVDDTPGTTRDRLFSETIWNGVRFQIIDTGGIDPSEGGKDPLSVGSADYISQIRAQALLAVEEADAVVFVTDAASGITPADQEVADLLRRYQKNLEGVHYPPIHLAVNKADNETLRAAAMEFYALGLGTPFPISAVHGTGTGDLLDSLVSSFIVNEEQEEDQSVKIAIVGKPNVGKSSLLNKLAGEERAIVSPIAGTTRDAIDSPITYEGAPITLIDTAGIRRKGKIDRGVEKYSVIRSMRAIERCDVALLLVDATQDISAQDTHIAGYILEQWKSTVVIVNKWDLVEKDTFTMEEYTRQIRQALNFVDYVPVLFISALTGQRVNKVLPLALQVQEERMARVGTGALNRILMKSQDLHSPSSKTGRQLRIYYGTQVRSDPPTFMLYVNDPQLMHFTYQRFLENQLRAVYPFSGTPIRFVLKKRS
ncbi:MAG TPA: ribosome biogenesis GTPase Der [Anaerolineaceae bacterium]|uniref:GTPase Der n=1 Tax=Anaerolinea thermophila TaxID=167964 RepID=A0A101FXQ9_9CHLR|nr:MAG: GTPase Der [Anaerolinea thermophila]HAF62569.1 ribosome biogenesis GTPase Der [Anaerolineaceae bacterium]